MTENWKRREDGLHESTMVDSTAACCCCPLARLVYRMMAIFFHCLGLTMRMRMRMRLFQLPRLLMTIFLAYSADLVSNYSYLTVVTVVVVVC